MKRILAAWFLMAFVLTSCSSQRRELSELAGFEISSSAIESIDKHEGFHGDGVSYAAVNLPDDFRARADAVFTRTDGWRAFPLSENVAAAVYGDEAHTAIFEVDGDIPEPPSITSGYWRLIDRHSESTDPYDDADLHSRASYNFTVIFYDAAANTLYFYALDT